jgi:5-oxoprolinase (ATP-hydrolysing)
VFAHDGMLVANAPHMPVHLGSMIVRGNDHSRQCGRIKPGDVYAINAPRTVAPISPHCLPAGV